VDRGAVEHQLDAHEDADGVALGGHAHHPAHEEQGTQQQEGVQFDRHVKLALLLLSWFCLFWSAAIPFRRSVFLASCRSCLPFLGSDLEMRQSGEGIAALQNTQKKKTSGPPAASLSAAPRPAPRVPGPGSLAAARR